MKTLLSLFDYSGIWGLPFEEAGWDVIYWDIKRSQFMDINLIDSAEAALDMFENVDGILAAPPCTHFTISGAQYWAEKDADGRTEEAIRLVKQVQRLANLFRPTDPDYDGCFFWVVENPVGRMGTVTGMGHPIYFHPYEFSGYLEISGEDKERLKQIHAKNGRGVTEEETELVIQCNAYKKKTGLWGEFAMPSKRPLFPVRCSPQGSYTQRYGGKSDETKKKRSNTPLGFARAFYEANKNYQAHLMNNELWQ